MITWPDDLVLDLARRRTVIVLGAGISMNSINAGGIRPKSWLQLLEEGTTKLTAKSLKLAKRLIKERDYLAACEIIKNELGKANYESFLTSEYLEPRFEASAVHESIFRLDSRIVATPNIDKIYETRANHLAHGSIKIKHYYEDDLADTIRRHNYVILKIHGTIDSPSKMIFTRQEYAQARSDYAYFYSILDALIATHTFIFLGCGINDPDIRLLLENYAFRYKNVRPHYITLSSDLLSDMESELIEASTNLKILRYSPKDNHKELHESIDSLQAVVDAKRAELATSISW